MKSWQELRNRLEWEIFPRWEEKYFAHAGIVLSASYENLFHWSLLFFRNCICLPAEGSMGGGSLNNKLRWGMQRWRRKKELHNNQSKTGARGGNETIHSIKLLRGRTAKPSRTYLCFFLLSRNYTLKLPRAETAKYLEPYKKWNGNAVDDWVSISNSL